MEKAEVRIPLYQRDHIPDTTNYHKKNKKSNFKLQNILFVLAFVSATGFLILSYSFFLLPTSPPDIILGFVFVSGFNVSSSESGQQINLHHWEIPFLVKTTDENRILDFDDFTVSVLYKNKINISSVTLEPFQLQKRPVTIERWSNKGFKKRFQELKTAASSIQLPDKSVAESAIAELEKGAMRFTFQFSARMTSRLLWRAVTKQVNGSCEEMEVEFHPTRDQCRARMTSRLFWRAVTKQVNGSCNEMKFEFPPVRDSDTVCPGGARIGISRRTCRFSMR